jgi:preprotein translocase subunit SecE
MSNHPIQTVTTTNDKAKLALAIGALIAGIVGFYLIPERSDAIRAGVLVVGLILAAVFALTSTQGRDFIAYAKESVRETKKVVWPSRKEATQMTAIVFAFVFVMALFLWGTDKLLEVLLYDFVLGWR